MGVSCGSRGRVGPDAEKRATTSSMRVSTCLSLTLLTVTHARSWTWWLCSSARRPSMSSAAMSRLARVPWRWSRLGRMASRSASAQDRSARRAWSRCRRASDLRHLRRQPRCASRGVPIIGDGGCSSPRYREGFGCGRRHRDGGRPPCAARRHRRRGLRQRQAIQAYRGMGSLGAMQSRGERAPTPRIATSKMTS